ncbi:hypothetical protein HMPREF1984_00653 [Leptotrichia sp. oral taxon 215 str. W9775]|nr:hypothetical protein HMPREF1984_00653 [Leptotrichia sp. oral taxon 215 str. W9775]
MIIKYHFFCYKSIKNIHLKVIIYSTLNSFYFERLNVFCFGYGNKKYFEYKIMLFF